MALKRFDSLILPILFVAVKSRIHTGGNFSTCNKTEVERVHLQFLERLLGVLNISTRNIMVRSELNWKDTLDQQWTLMNNLRKFYR